jgi:hypothetical protein
MARRKAGIVRTIEGLRDIWTLLSGREREGFSLMRAAHLTKSGASAPSVARHLLAHGGADVRCESNCRIKDTHRRAIHH